MNSSTVRVIVSKDGYDEQAISKALGYAKAIADSKSITQPDVILLTHTKQQLKFTSLASMLGDGVSKALAANKKVNLQFGGKLRNESLKTLSPYESGKIVIACYGDEKLLDFVDSIASPAGVIVIPDLSGSAASWIKRWNPVIHGKEKSEPLAILDDPIVESAMTSLTKIVNLSTGIGHPRDKEYANECFRILKAKGHTLESDSIKSWAIQNGWKPLAAKDLAKLAQKVSKLQTKPRLNKIYDPEGKYARWQN